MLYTLHLERRRCDVYYTGGCLSDTPRFNNEEGREGGFSPNLFTTRIITNTNNKTHSQ